MPYKTYIVTNKITGQKHYSMADSAQEACQEAGWMVGDCSIEESPRSLYDRHKYDYLKEEA